MSSLEEQAITVPLIQQPRLLGRLWRELAVLLVGTVFMALLARVEVRLEPFTPVPISGQTLGVLLIGALYGPWRGGLCLLAYLGEGAAGLPVFSGGAFGIAALFGPTGGYLVSFPVAAVVAGLLVQPLRAMPGPAPGLILASLLIYAVGVPWLAVVTGMSLPVAMSKGMLPFIPGDLLKVLIAAAVLPSGMTALGALGYPFRLTHKR